MSTEELIVQARARIIWGDEPASVHSFLTASGMAHGDADIAIETLMAERARHIRRNGLRHACVGAAILCVCVALIICEITDPSDLSIGMHGRAILFPGAIGLLGLWKLVGGLANVLCPTSETRSLTDV